MNKISVALFLASMVLVMIACQPQPATSAATPTEEPAPLESPEVAQSHIAIFEIPATDIDRAIAFYQTVLSMEIEKMEFPGMQMGLMPYENQLVTGVIMQGEGYEPSSAGVTIYLNAGEDLQLALDKVEAQGGQIIIPKTPHADESGYFAIFLDTEGNKMGLHSPS
ncbi:MAG: VOC family protein [Bacteroidota bacterium]